MVRFKGRFPEEPAFINILNTLQEVINNEKTYLSP